MHRAWPQRGFGARCVAPTILCCAITTRPRPRRCRCRRGRTQGARRARAHHAEGRGRGDHGPRLGEGVVPVRRADASGRPTLQPATAARSRDVFISRRPATLILASPGRAGRFSRVHVVRGTRPRGPRPATHRPARRGTPRPAGRRGLRRPRRPRCRSRYRPRPARPRRRPRRA